MFWSKEDHRLHQPNYYNNFQIVQHQNGIQQAPAALPPHHQQQQQHHHSTPPPQLQQQQQQQQQQHPQQGHRPTQHIPTHFSSNQQMQHQHHPPQWATRPPPILTTSPFFQQFPTPVPSTAQYCGAPAQYFHPQRVTQPPGVAAPSQQRPLLPPPGCAMYPTLRQNVLSQPPAALMTQTPSSTAQQIQVQYFSAAQYCQPPIGQPAYGHVITPSVPETPMVKPRRHAIPIIDPKTRENILERELRRSECTSPADALSTGATTSSDLRESVNDWEVVQQSHHQQRLQQQQKQKLQYPQQRQLPTPPTQQQQQHNSLHQLVHHREMPTATINDAPIIVEKELPVEETEKENNEQGEEEEAMTEQSVDGSQPTTQVDHVESIEADEELESTLTDEENQLKNDHSERTPQATNNSTQTTTNSPASISSITTTPNSTNSAVTTTPVTNESEVESSKCSDTDKETAPVAEINPPTVIEIVEKPSASAQKSSAAAPPAAEAAKPNKQQQQSRKQQHQPPPPATKPTSKKSKKNSKRLKEIQKKQQKTELLSIESNNNNNTLKTTNKCETEKSKSSSEPSGRGTSKAKATANNSNSCAGAGAGMANKSNDDLERNSESEPTKKIAVVTETPSTVKDDTEQNPQSDSDSKSMKYKQIIEILSIESNENNELLFLNSSVSGYEDDICSSPPVPDTSASEKTKDILFGDFSDENPAQEMSVQNDNDLESQDEVDDSPASNPTDGKKLSYTLQQLKNLANNPDSKIPPKLKGTICDIIMKNLRRGASSSNMQPATGGQQNQMFQQLSYKDSMSYVNRNRNKQQMKQQQQQQQQQQRNPNIIRIYLSLDEEIQLAQSANAWVPADLQKWGPKTDSDNDEQILKKIRSILNKLTPENFSKLLENATKFQITGEECMKKIMLLIFEKTISEPNFAPTYARFCKCLFNQQHPNHSMFKTNLVKRIWEEFDTNVNNAKAKNAKLQPLMDKLAAATDPKERLELKAELDDQEYQFRRRAWGTVRFIGEMCKVGFIDTDRVCLCIDNLLDRNCEEKLEYMCKLLTTVGAHLEPVDTKKRPSAEKNKMDAIFNTIRQFVMEKKKGVGPKISSRVRFMMQDVLELRLRRWDQKPASILPSREVSPMFTAHVQPQRNVRMGRDGGGGGGGNYMSSGGYDKRRQGGESQKNSSQQNIDVNKLLPLFNKDETTRKLGNSSQLLFKTTGRPQQQQIDRPQSGSLESESKESQSPPAIEFTNSECKRLLNELIDLALEQDKKHWFEKWDEISPAHHSQIIYYLLAEFIHTKYMNSPKEINACIRLFTSLMKETHLTQMSFTEGYRKFGQICEDILVDVPKCWEYVFNLLGPLLYHKFIPFNKVWSEEWFNTSIGDKFLKSMIVQFTTEFGANYMRSFWECNSLQWNQFIADTRVSTFIRNNRFDFIDNCEKPPMFIKRSADELVQRIKTLFGQSDQDIPLIIDFINTNVNIDSKFINTLTMFLCDYTVIYCYTPDSSSISSYSSKEINLSDSLPVTLCSSLSSKLQQKFVKCIPLLRRCIDCKDEHEFACLDAILEKCNILCKSQDEDLISMMLMELYVAEVISKESFDKWHQQLRAEGNNKLTNELDAFFKKLSII